MKTRKRICHGLSEKSSQPLDSSQLWKMSHGEEVVLDEFLKVERGCSTAATCSKSNWYGSGRLRLVKKNKLDAKVI